MIDWLIDILFEISPSLSKVRTSVDCVTIYVKGAENAILPRCTVGSIDAIQASVDAFAQEGLRTLAMAERKLSNEQWIAAMTELNEAQNFLVDREKKVREVYDYLENNLTLLGATGVEDRLQDGVEETLESLRVAGIKTWILTGDKQETAVNVSYSCGHFKKTMQVRVNEGFFNEPIAGRSISERTAYTFEQSVSRLLSQRSNINTNGINQATSE